MLTIAKLSFKETIYKRIFLITVLMTLAFLVFYGIASHFAAGQVLERSAHTRSGLGGALIERTFFATQFLGIGLFFASFITALLTILASVGSISGEIESHQIDTLLARPLRRRDIILGKLIGLGGLLVVYAALLYSGILLVNQLFGGELRVMLTAEQVLTAGLLFALQPLVVLPLALWLSTMTTTINGGIIVIILYGTGFVGGFVEQFGAMFENPSLANIGILSSLVFPLDSLFRKTTILLFDTADDPLSFAASGLFGSVSAPSTAMLVYCGLYAVGTCFFAIRKFNTRDL